MIQHNKPTLDNREEQAALRVIKSGWLAQGPEVEKFEAEFCQFLGLPEQHAVAVANGTSALFLALWALRAGNKTTAIPVYGCASLRHAVSMAGSREILLDTAPGSPNIDPEQVNRTEADLIIIPHMFGLPLDLAGLDGREIIEDCAQALGAKVRGRFTGLEGRLGVFSFGATKLMTSGGQGGMVASRDRDLVDAIRDYRQFDCRHDRKQRFNFQMTDLQAAIGRVQLAKLPSFLSRRDRIFQKYHEAGFKLLGAESEQKPDIQPARFRAVLKTAEPGRLIEALSRAGIKAIVPVEDWELLGSPELFPQALELTRTTVSLPVYPSLTDDEVNRIIQVLS